MNNPISDKPTLSIVLGNGNIGREVARVISQLDNLMVIDRPINCLDNNIIYTITNNSDLFESKTNFTPDREYGWYRCFEKSNKKGNLK